MDGNISIDAGRAGVAGNDAFRDRASCASAPSCGQQRAQQQTLPQSSRSGEDTMWQLRHVYLSAYKPLVGDSRKEWRVIEAPRTGKITTLYGRFILF